MDDQSPDAIPWWKSKIVVGCAVATVTDLVHLFHLTKYLTTDQISDIADIGLQVAVLASIGYAFRGRLVQKVAAPVTFTRSKAATINAAKQPSPPPETPQ